MKALHEFVLFKKKEEIIKRDVLVGEVIDISSLICYNYPFGIGNTLYVDRKNTTYIKDSIYACNFFNIIAFE